MATNRNYYAFSHSHGADTAWEGESASGTLHVFEDKTMRDEWVEGGPAYRHESGFRTEMKARHPKVREYKRASEKGFEVGHLHHKEDGTVKVFRKGGVRPVETADSFEELPSYAK